MTHSEIRQQMCRICRNMWQLGWAAANDGNVSAKTEEGNWIVTPTGVSKSLITEDMLLLVDENMNILEGSGNYRPSSEMKMHMRCYRERNDIGAVVHAHPPTATGFAVAGLPMDEYCMIETVLSFGSIPVAPYATPSTEEVPDSIAPYLQNHDALLLANHGALTVGADLMTAYYRMETLEHYAKILLTARLLGGARELTPPQINTLLDLRESKYHLTGRHPGYRKYGIPEEKHE